MGLLFGDLYKMRGIVTFKVSSFEQSAFKGIISKGVPNVIRRMRESSSRMIPTFAFLIFITNFADATHKRYNRKNPKDYENDV